MKLVGSRSRTVDPSVTLERKGTKGLSQVVYSVWSTSTSSNTEPIVGATTRFEGGIFKVSGGGGGKNTRLKEDGEVCLLYTSPSPRDQRGSRMPSSA